MTITELRILPPIAVARLGASETPLENYDLVADEDEPLGFRRIVPAETFRLEQQTGEILDCYVPEEIRFRDGPRIRPVAPFLEVWARTDEDRLVPLTRDMLEELGLAPSDVRWTVQLANMKIFRRTSEPGDRILAEAEVSGHERVPMTGRCDNFLPGKTLPLGFVQYVKPNDDFPEIRLRYTPAAGLVYGAKKTRATSATEEEKDPILVT
ncbi:MAG TPA: hypothetical protein VFR28_00340, partial [Allosphingosinicella sp.]|nr:hypothetical protein [Allosphingosinicella sp.]